MLIDFARGQSLVGAKAGVRTVAWQLPEPSIPTPTPCSWPPWVQVCLQSRAGSRCLGHPGLPGQHQAPSFLDARTLVGFQTHTSVGSDTRLQVRVWPLPWGVDISHAWPPSTYELGALWGQESREPRAGHRLPGWETPTQSTRASVSGRLAGREPTKEHLGPLGRKAGLGWTPGGWGRGSCLEAPLPHLRGLRRLEVCRAMGRAWGQKSGFRF